VSAVTLSSLKSSNASRRYSRNNLPLSQAQATSSLNVKQRLTSNNLDNLGSESGLAPGSLNENDVFKVCIKTMQRA
jgi:hypothetical protein